VLYPVGQTPFQPTEVHLALRLAGPPFDLHWPVAGLPYREFLLQTATNFTEWVTLTTLTNSGGRFDYSFDGSATEAARFFRTVQKQ